MVRSDLPVLNWLADQDQQSMRVSAVSVMEIEFGLRRLPEGRRRAELDELTEALMHSWASRIVVIDEVIARVAGSALAQRESVGRPLGAVDAQIAASALVLGATLATRNTRDFMGLGLELVDPWAA